MARAPAERAATEDGSTQRIRVGALGLACVFLLVMLATALLRATSDADPANQQAVSGTNGAEPSEPLAQLGVAPGNAPPDFPSPAVRPAPRQR